MNCGPKHYLERQQRYLEKPSPNSSYWFSSRSFTFFPERLQPCEIEYSAFGPILTHHKPIVQAAQRCTGTHIPTHVKSDSWTTSHPSLTKFDTSKGKHNEKSISLLTKQINLQNMNVVLWCDTSPDRSRSDTREGMAARSEKPQETMWVAPTWTCNINVKEDRRWRKAIPSVLMSVVQMHNVQFDLPLNELCYRHSVSFLPSVEIMHDH
ncbi:NADH dehydrogenase [ubiquinone] 1 alpha subcomplex assembly factor [Trichinella spiralis]|uniref:NADH dehydrogenase [ubiquinone] 1 alpha subcomplex assembly factor n=1 Tax=Trichinella spiralis TaxID=6334 RepID=A0ABR3KLA8_TRISP